MGLSVTLMRFPNTWIINIPRAVRAPLAKNDSARVRYVYVYAYVYVYKGALDISKE